MEEVCGLQGQHGHPTNFLGNPHILEFNCIYYLKINYPKFVIEQIEQSSLLKK